jgi:glycerol-3-phosphate O-acyltransferase
VQIGEMIDFNEFIQESLEKSGQEARTPAELSPSQRRNMIRGLAHRVMYSINEVTVITPAALVATVLLSHSKRGMSRRDLIETSEELLSTLESEGARVPQQLRIGSGSIREDTIDEALRLFMDARLIVEHATGPEPIYTVDSERRIALEYYQNTLIHFFIPRALIAVALLVDSGQWVEIERLRERVQQLSRLFKHEFMFRTDASFEDIFADALQTMLKDEEIELQGNTVRATEGTKRQRIERYAAMLQTFFESYLLALRGAETVLDGPIQKKDWYKRTLSLGQQMYLAGEIERRESLSKLKLETALRALDEYKLVKHRGDTLERGNGFESVEDLRALEPKLTAFLR